MSTMSQISPGETLDRKLVPIEEGTEILNRLAKSSYVVTMSRVKGPLSEEILRQALDLIQYRYPCLNCRIVGSLDNLWFQTGGVSKIPLRVVDNLYNEHWQEVVLEELNQGIESDKCLMRAVLVRAESENSASYLITSTHHAISDGLSCVRLHSGILTYCEKIHCGEPITSVLPLPILPPIDRLIPISTRGFQGIWHRSLLLLRIIFNQVWYRPKTLGFEKCVPINLRRCGMVQKSLDKGLTQELINRCKKEKTTVHGAVCGAMLLTAAKSITVNKKKRLCVSCLSYVDLRRRLEPVVSDEVMGSLVSCVTSFHTLQSNLSFWDLARNVKKQLEYRLNGANIFRVIIITKIFLKRFLKRPNQGSATVSVTNIGKVNIPKHYGAFELEEISFGSANASFGGSLSVAVSTFDEKMILNFMFSDPSISHDSMEIFANNVMSYLIDACLPKVA
ncbi:MULTISPECIES: condensation domain-containing protein [unclassified Moorena]|uniref:phthiocerol/phthiodiolone dimycocerosyl transferase family protein n=1 Tax=unclassified Moorena TaxID=2683338 RepID=UPI001400C92C|nr:MULTISPECIES: condensation domain-containing protein [unclassified Moorena]NEO10837.1 alcohol acetyltransferase [Moorena sp. SIO3E8]NEP97472.1 alcohol acetyltransferase [Moorena sp. SIO3F7]